MSGKNKKTRGSFTSMQSARKETKNTPVTQPGPDESLMPYKGGRVTSRSSPSKLAELHKNPQARKEWDNDVRFHVAANLLHLRRWREQSQKKVAAAVRTSQ